MFGKLQVLLNSLEALGQMYSKAHINLKVLDNFPKVWEPKTTTIQEARDLKNLAQEELLGILIINGVHLQNNEHLQQNSTTVKSKATSFRREEEKSFSKALIVQIQESDGLENSVGSTDDKVNLMSRKFKQMMKKKGNFQHSSRRKDSRFQKKNQEESNEIIYFKCRKLGHIKAEFTQLKKRRYSKDKIKKILMVTWDESDSEQSSISNDGQANIYLMADTNDKTKVKTCSESNIFLVLPQTMKRICPMIFFFRTFI